MPCILEINFYFAINFALFFPCNGDLFCDNLSLLRSRILTPYEGDWPRSEYPADFPRDRAIVNALALVMCHRLNEPELIPFRLNSPL